MSDAAAPRVSTVAPAAQTSTTKARGLLLVVASSFAFSTMALCVSLLHTRFPSLQLAFTRYGASAVGSVAAIAWARRGTLRAPATWLGRPEHRRLLVMRGVWGACGMVAYFYALSVLQLSDASALAFTQVPLTAIAARVLLGEPYTWLDASCAVLCMGGVVLVAQPAALFGGAAGGGAAVPLTAVATSLFGACTSSLAYVAVRQMQGADNLVITLYFSIIGTLVAPTLMVLTRQPLVAVASVGDAALLAVVGVGGFVGQVLLNRGIQLAPAGPATVMRYGDIIWALVFQSTLLGEPPAPLKLLGAALIMSCVVAVLVRARRGAVANAAAAAPAAAASTAATSTTGGDVAVDAGEADGAGDSDVTTLVGAVGAVVVAAACGAGDGAAVVTVAESEQESPSATAAHAQPEGAGALPVGADGRAETEVESPLETEEETAALVRKSDI